VAGAETITGSGTKGKAWSAMGMYDNGPLMASLAYERHSFGSAGTGSLGSPAVFATPVVPATVPPTFAVTDFSGRMERAWKVGVGYKIMPALQMGFAYERTRDDLDGGSNALVTTLGPWAASTAWAATILNWPTPGLATMQTPTLVPTSGLWVWITT